MIEEDIILTENFEEKVEAVIQDKPDNVINFFSMRKEDLTIGSRWQTAYGGTLCTYLPVGYAQQIINYYPIWHDTLPEIKLDKHGVAIPIKYRGKDDFTGEFLRSRKERHWLHIPNLVDHRIGKSAIDYRRSSKRVSKTFKNGIPFSRDLLDSGDN